MKKSVYLFLLLFLIPCHKGDSFVLSNKNIRMITYYDMIKERKEYIKTQDFDYGLFVEYLELINVRNRNIVISQSILESNWFSSDIFLKNNNLFGMKQARVRETTAIGTNRNHAKYEHWTHSVEDYKLWYDYVTRKREYVNYFCFLTAMGYAEDPYYIPKLKQIKNELISNEYLLAYEN